MTDINTQRNEDLGNLPESLRANPFAVPEGYFEDITQRTVLRAHLRQVSEEASTIPQGYFDQLQAGIMGRVRLEELKSGQPEAGMSVPEGYFDSLSEKMQASLRASSVPAIDTPVRRIGVRQWLPYVAASLLLLAVGAATFLGIGTADPETSVASNLQAVPEQEIISYLELYAESDYLLYQSSYDAEIGEWLDEDFSEADIEAYFNNTL